MLLYSQVTWTPVFPGAEALTCVRRTVSELVLPCCCSEAWEPILFVGSHAWPVLNHRVWSGRSGAPQHSSGGASGQSRRKQGRPLGTQHPLSEPSTSAFSVAILIDASARCFHVAFRFIDTSLGLTGSSSTPLQAVELNLQMMKSEYCGTIPHFSI